MHNNIVQHIHLRANNQRMIGGGAQYGSNNQNNLNGEEGINNSDNNDMNMIND